MVSAARVDTGRLGLADSILTSYTSCVAMLLCKYSQSTYSDKCTAPRYFTSSPGFQLRAISLRCRLPEATEYIYDTFSVLLASLLAS